MKKKELRYIVFGVDGNVRKSNVRHLYATSSNQKIFVFNDADISTEETAFNAFARVMRSDGFKADSPKTLVSSQINTINTDYTEEELTNFLESIEVDYRVCRILELTKPMLAVEGALEITVVYNRVNEFGKVIETQAKGIVSPYVNKAVEEILTEDEYNSIKEEMLPRDLGDITVSEEFNDDDHLVVTQNGVTKKITGKKLKEEVIKNVVNDTLLEEQVEDAVYDSLTKKEQEYAPRLNNLEVNKADKTALQAVASGSPKGVYTTVAELTGAFPTGDTNIYLVLGNVKEVVTLTITGVVVLAGDVTVTLNGIATNIAMDESEVTVDLVAAKIRNTAFAGWVTSGTGSTVIFTAVVAETKSDAIYSAGDTGASGNMTTITQGAEPDGNWYYWNGAAWTSGGVYQATGITDNSVTGKKINMDNVEVLGEDLSLGNRINDKYITGVGQELSYGDTTTGGVTGFISVIAGKKYSYFSYTNDQLYVGCYYDSAKKYIGKLNVPVNIESPVEMVMPTNAAYIRVNFNYATVAQFYVKEVLLQKFNPKWLILDVENLPDKLIQEKHLDDNFKLAADKLNIEEITYLSDNLVVGTIQGVYVNASGVETNYPIGSENGVTTLIPINPLDKIKYFCYTNSNLNGCIYDAEQKFIKTLDYPEIAFTYHEMIMPANAAFVRLNYSRFHLDKIHVFKYLYGMYNIAWLNVIAKNISNGAISIEKLSPDLQTIINNASIPDGSIETTKLSESALLELKSTEILNESVTLEKLSQSVKDYIANPSSTPNNPFDGKKSTWIGDSITQGTGTTSSTKRYADIVTSKLSMSAIDYQNLGLGGSTVANQSDGWPTKSFVTRICDEAQIRVGQDYIFIFGGLNDFARNTPLSTMNGALDYFDVNGTWDDFTFYGALHRLIKYIRDNHSASKLIYIVPMHFKNERIPNSQEKLLIDYVNAVREVCEYYAIPIIDLFKELPIDYKNTYDSNNYSMNGSLTAPDGTHPNDAGNAIIANKIVNYLKYNYIV